MPIRLQDQVKTALMIRQGYYQWWATPFDLYNTLATFQALINKMFGKYLCKFVLVFSDNILKFAPDHLENIHGAVVNQHILWLLQYGFQAGFDDDLRL